MKGAKAINPDWIRPDWPVEDTVNAISTTRVGGVSSGPYASLNLGAHVGDDPEAVARNRSILLGATGLTEPPLWLNQVHGCQVAQADAMPDQAQLDLMDADAAVSRKAGQACVIMTADCLPVLFCDRKATVVAAAHAGWRGLAAGVLENTVKRMAVNSEDIMAWLGPAIGPDAFEVGPEVRQAFMEHSAQAKSAFRPSPSGRWLADIYTLARQRLAETGVT
ncbi:MAG: peptidoglycan editing factor PgeF, partial [Gammaproteobacteria bacterium]